MADAHMRSSSRGFALIPWLMLSLLCCSAEALSASPIPPQVRAAIDTCYPPSAYSTRRGIAYDAALASTNTFTDEGIPLAGDSMVYGEFDLSFFADLLDLAKPQRGETFVDAGSGVGRLVMAAALLHPNKWRNCHGVELSSPLHDAAISARYAFEEIDDAPLIAPTEYTLSDCMSSAGLEAIKAADVAFSYAVTWANDETHGRLVQTFARHLPNGARVISIDLPFSEEAAQKGGSRFDLVARKVGANEETGTETVGLVYKVVRD